MTPSSEIMATTAAKLTQKRANHRRLNLPKLTPCSNILRCRSSNRLAAKTATPIPTGTLLPSGRATTLQSRLTPKHSRPMAITMLIISNITPCKLRQPACQPKSILTNIMLKTHSTRSITNSTSTTRRPASLTSKRDTHITSIIIRAHSTQQAQGRSATKAKDGDASGAEPKDDNEVTIKTGVNSCRRPTNGAKWTSQRTNSTTRNIIASTLSTTSSSDK